VSETARYDSVTHQVARDEARFDHLFDEPLNDGEALVQIETLNLVRLKGMRAL
jgi:hypothetical protein